MTNKHKKNTYTVKKTLGGLLLLDNGSGCFDEFFRGDEVTAIIKRQRPVNCINQKEVAKLLGVPYGSLRQQIYTGRYKLPKCERVGCNDFYRIDKIKAWINKERSKK